MAEVTLYKKDGSTSGKISLSDNLFAVPVKLDLVHEAIIIQEANGRTRYAQTKDRSEVRGGGKKPWKQKGTGRARHGSRRSPIWIGGGITFGPNALRNFSKKINKKARRKALAMMLSDKVNEDLFIAVEDLTIDGKTKELKAICAALPGAGKSTLLITGASEANVVLAAQNLPNVTTIGANSLNVRDLAKFKYVIASKDAIEKINETYNA